jgi:hypothetical protein
MKHQTSLPRWAGLFFLVFAAAVSCGSEARGAAEAKSAVKEKRADLLIIDARTAEEKRELPAVSFLHDRHTEAVKALRKDCGSCHAPLKEGEKAFSFRFKGSEDLTGDALKTLYHANCIGCHTEAAQSGHKTGPLEAECRDCHRPRSPVGPDRRDMGFDKALHYRHIASPGNRQDGEEKSCGLCHHVYDAGAKKTVWGKNREDSCRACHSLPEKQNALLTADRDAADENGKLSARPTLDVAAHQACVNCHLAVADEKGTGLLSGPTDCAGCHSSAARARFAAATTAKTDAETGAETAGATDSGIPRLERGQKDAVLLMPVPASDNELKGMMRPVSFNHKLHEAATPDCRGCHHKKILSCSACHSQEGKAEGDFIPLAEAMHAAESGRSCIGCHNRESAKPSCAGCHSKNSPAYPSAQSCPVCHSTPDGFSDAEAENGSLLKLTDEAAGQLAKAAVAARGEKRVTTPKQNDIPEKVQIGILSDEYKAVGIEHRKIVNSLAEKQKDSRLASVFHTEDTTLCQGCHHNSPSSMTPPRCVSCHGAGARSALSGHPPLKVAYHRQCMTCHERMEQKPAATECAGCHEPRGKEGRR